MTISKLLAVPEKSRERDWLREALQSAVEIEYFTIPPYLSGYWSIIPTPHPVRDYLEDIFLQEMLHMGLACNMLSTLGGVPNIKGKAPTYPNSLPGGVRPDLKVWLAGLSRAMVRGVYMEIEYPENGPITRFMGEPYPTIGSLYDAILDAFKRLPESEVKKTRQREYPGLGGPGLFRVDSVGDALRAIGTIKEQGEGTSQNPYPNEAPEDRAHYYRFGEMYHGRTLIKKAGRWVYEGEEVRLPPAYPMAEVPPGGYPDGITKDFNTRYTQMVNLLQSAWEREDGQPCLERAVKLMPSLTGLAQKLVASKLDDGSGNYGPDFRILPGVETPC